MAKAKRLSRVPERCPEHAKDEFGFDMISAAMDADERIERGEEQQQCAKCLRWLWPHQQGPGFVSTGVSDVD